MEPVWKKFEGDIGKDLIEAARAVQPVTVADGVARRHAACLVAESRGVADRLAPRRR